MNFVIIFQGFVVFFAVLLLLIFNLRARLLHVFLKSIDIIFYISFATLLISVLWGYPFKQVSEIVVDSSGLQESFDSLESELKIDSVQEIGSEVDDLWGSIKDVFGRDDAGEGGGEDERASSENSESILWFYFRDPLVNLLTWVSRVTVFIVSSVMLLISTYLGYVSFGLKSQDR